MSEFFKFEDTTRDIPYYRHNPKLSKTAWIVLLLSIPISFIVYMIAGIESEMAGSILFVLIMLVPLMYYSDWDFSLIFHKPTKGEIKLAVMLFIGYMIYAIAVGEVLELIGQASTATGDYLGVTWEMLFALVFSMLGEELVKFIPLMFFMRFVFKYTNNRKLAIVVSAAIVLIFFGLLHYDAEVTPILSVLLIQGLGSIFEVYGYIKTKNMFVPYLCHLLTDGFIFLMMLIGLA
ncbi:type II CAAX prenyl endopeptidase Rce1 family protein [Methanobrevibacter sp.]|uniref:CPBP family glutamic-type intramembrane protease n=1 Tax=Methanobrevibacter sp. TaxID=66852 RepID=UPI00386E6C05